MLDLGEVLFHQLYCLNASKNAKRRRARHAEKASRELPSPLVSHMRRCLQRLALIRQDSAGTHLEIKVEASLIITPCIEGVVALYVPVLGPIDSPPVTSALEQRSPALQCIHDTVATVKHIVARVCDVSERTQA